MWLVRSELDGVWDNLALEEHLLQASLPAGGALFLCRNRPAVVLGKNQNPWRECRVERMAGLGVSLARRVSGGGTVYHDAGNLNYGLVVPRSDYDRERCFAWVLGALRRCGIAAERSGATSLAVGGRKISGTAFAIRRDAVLHHGTLLIDSDLALLRETMRLPDAEIEGTSIRSEPAEVINLRDVRPLLDARTLEASLEEGLADVFGARCSERFGHDRLDPAGWLPLARRNRTVAWRLGGALPFRAALPCPGGWRFSIDVRHDRVRDASLRAPCGAERAVSLRGLRFRPSRLSARLRSVGAQGGGAGGDEMNHAANRLAAAWC